MPSHRIPWEITKFYAFQQKQTASTLLPGTSRMLVDSSFRPSPRQKPRVPQRLVSKDEVEFFRTVIIYLG